MNLFESDYCPICNDKLDNDNECAKSNHYFNYKCLAFHNYKEKFSIVLKDNGKCLIYNFENYKTPLISDIIQIELTLENKEKIIEYLKDKLEATIRNSLFL